MSSAACQLAADPYFGGPDSQPLSGNPWRSAMKPMPRLALCALFVALVPARPAGAQVVNDHSNRWYWGAQAGGFLYQTNGQGYAFDPLFGAHWLITAKRTALYLGGEQAFFITDAIASVGDPNSATGLRDATFSQVRRLFVGVLAFPLQRRIEPYLGGGFAIVTVQNAVVDCSNTTPNSQCASANDVIAAQSFVDDASSTATAWFTGGIQINVGKLAVYGQYMLTSASQNFLLAGSTHSIQGGVRYALGRSKEDVNTAH
jgi:opacity protein-like surface antigen